MSLTAAQARELFQYDPETGVLRWRGPRRRPKPGNVAGSARADGYLIVHIDGRSHYVHRVIWLYVYGECPKFLDHINGDPTDNRLLNLRVATYTINNQNRRRASRNSLTGLLGVTKIRWGDHYRYQSRIQYQRRKVYLGTFDTPHEAHHRYLQVKRKLHEGNTL